MTTILKFLRLEVVNSILLGLSVSTLLGVVANWALPPEERFPWPAVPVVGVLIALGLLMVGSILFVVGGIINECITALRRRRP